MRAFLVTLLCALCGVEWERLDGSMSEERRKKKKESKLSGGCKSLWLNPAPSGCRVCVGLECVCCLSLEGCSPTAQKSPNSHGYQGLPTPPISHYVPHTDLWALKEGICGDELFGGGFKCHPDTDLWLFFFLSRLYLRKDPAIFATVWVISMCVDTPLYCSPKGVKAAAFWWKEDYWRRVMGETLKI